jgi:hypothetical protein
VGIANRVDGETALAIKDEVPEANYHYRSRLSIAKRPESTGSAVGNIAVVAAGTSNLTVAKEAFLVAQALSNQTELDVDAAEIHRLLEAWDCLPSAQVIMVVGGMAGALASVIEELADCPVLAVLSLVGYGTAQGGMTAVLASRINHLAD